jgi:hypothetical protein
LLTGTESEVIPMGGNTYDEKDAAEETDSSVKEVNDAWHEARDNAQDSDHPIDKSLTEGWDRKRD